MGERIRSLRNTVNRAAAPALLGVSMFSGCVGVAGEGNASDTLRVGEVGGGSSDAGEAMPRYLYCTSPDGEDYFLPGEANGIGGVCICIDDNPDQCAMHQDPRITTK